MKDIIELMQEYDSKCPTLEGTNVANSFSEPSIEF